MIKKLITISALLGAGSAKSLYDTQRSDVKAQPRGGDLDKKATGRDRRT